MYSQGEGATNKNEARTTHCVQISVEGPFRIKGVLMFSREVMHKYIVDYNSYQLKCEC